MARNDHGSKSGHGHQKGPGGSVKMPIPKGGKGC